MPGIQADITIARGSQVYGPTAIESEGKSSQCYTDSKKKYLTGVITLSYSIQYENKVLLLVLLKKIKMAYQQMFINPETNYLK